MEFPKIRTIFQKFPNIQFKDPNVKQIKRTEWNIDKKSAPNKKKKKVKISGWGKPIGGGKVKRNSNTKSKSGFNVNRKYTSKQNLRARFSLEKTPEINDADFPIAKQMKVNNEMKVLKISKSKSTTSARKIYPEKVVKKKLPIKVVKEEEHKEEKEVQKVIKKEVKKIEKVIVKKKVEETKENIEEKPVQQQQKILTSLLPTKAKSTPSVQKPASQVTKTPCETHEISLHQSTDDFDESEPEDSISEWSSLSQSLELPEGFTPNE